MSCDDKIPTVPGRYTEGDLEDPLVVRWNETLTTETSEIIIDRPGGAASVTVTGVLLDADTGTFNYPWSAGDLIAGEGQMCKARLYRAGPRRKSTQAFKINVDEDIA